MKSPCVLPQHDGGHTGRTFALYDPVKPKTSHEEPLKSIYRRPHFLMKNEPTFGHQKYLKALLNLIKAPVKLLSFLHQKKGRNEVFFPQHNKKQNLL